MKVLSLFDGMALKTMLRQLISKQPYIPPGNVGSNKQANNNNNAWAEFLREANSGG